MNVLAQYGRNQLLILDMAANSALGGDPAEPLSRRTARACVAGAPWAIVACRLFNLFGRKPCACSLLPGSAGREIWSWSPPEAMPETITFPAKIGLASP